MPSFWWEEGPDLRVSMGPVTGLQGVAEQLIRQFEIDPAEHDGLLTEVEFAIGEQLLETMRDILAERGIPIPAEVDALPMPSGRKRGRKATGSYPSRSEGGDAR